GMGDEAVKLFYQMPKESIDHLTYICVLNACSHSGLVDVARSIFNNIQTKTEIIYTTMIDCLSRRAAFEEAQQLIEQFERDHAPAITIYMPLLSGARNQKYSKLSQEVVDRMQKLFPNMKDSLVAASILLANVYASSGDIGKATDIKIELHKSGAKKRIGVTVTDIDGKLWKFRAHDRSHAESAEIHEQVDRMSKRIIEHGHKYDASWIVRPMEPDETIETLLCGHSERLAMAAHFIRNRKPKRIQMTKNLRICGDCHEVTKLVALIYQCEIVIEYTGKLKQGYALGCQGPSRDKFRRNHRFLVDRFDQHVGEQFDLELTAIEHLKRHINMLCSNKIQENHCGPKTRVALSDLIARQPDVLTLGETTNNLDIEWIDAIVDAIHDFEGGVNVVEHKQINQTDGDFDDYRKELLGFLVEATIHNPSAAPTSASSI
ncbi:unnamed protein product, partial [Rotaria socialis]